MKQSPLPKGSVLCGLLLAGMTQSCDAGDGSVPSASALEISARHASADASSVTSYTPLAVQVEPAARCVIRYGDADDSKEIAPIYANSDGIIRFFLDSTTVPSSGALGFLFDCVSTAGVQTKTEPVDVQTAVALARSSAANQWGSAEVRPSLAGDPLQWSQDDLIRGGYPPRPNRTATPNAYAEWLRVISTPLRRIHSGNVPHRDVADTFYDASTWSGAVLHQPSTVYMWAQGGWTVPFVIPGPDPLPFFDCWSSFWVGLDGGYLSTDILQTGTVQRAIRVPYVPNIYYYYAWIEWHSPSTSQVSTPLVVNPGDYVYAETWVGNSDGSYNIGGSYGWSYMANITAGTDYETYVVKPAGVSFVGDSAEWIMERPSIGGAPMPLANYGHAQMRNAAAVDTTGAGHDYLTDQSDELWMQINGRLLSEGGMYDSSTGRYDYYWEGSD